MFFRRVKYGNRQQTTMKTAETRVRRSRLTPDDLAPIVAYGARATWPAGFQLYQRGTPADGVFIVLDGHVLLRNRIKVGRGFVPVIATAGQTFGGEGLSPGSHYVTDANSAEETRTLFLSGAQFRAFVREGPGQALPLLSQTMSERAYLLEKLHELAALALSRLVSAGIAERKGMTFLIQPDSLAASCGSGPDTDAMVSLGRDVLRSATVNGSTARG